MSNSTNGTLYALIRVRELTFIMLEVLVGSFNPITHSVPRSRFLCFFDHVFGFHVNSKTIVLMTQPKPIRFNLYSKHPCKNKIQNIFVLILLRKN